MPSWRTRFETPALVAALAGLAVALVLALRAHPVEPSAVRWTWVAALLLVGVPLVTLANALRFSLSFRLAGQERPPLEVLRASVLASVANMLPLPGGVMLRIAYLRGPDAGLARATGITLGVSSVWLGLACAGTGGALVHLGDAVAGPVLLAVGLAGLVAGFAYLRRLPRGVAAWLWLLVLETAVFSVQAARFWAAFAALGVPIAWVQGLALSVSCVSGSVVAVVPAGLGVAELTAVLLAPLAGLGAATAFLAALLDRLVTMAGLAVAAGVLLLRGRRAA